MASHALQSFDATDIRTVPVRAVVHDFALAMEEQLLLNDHKGGWTEEEISWLLGRARKELQELEDAIRQQRPVSEVLAEAADVGNFSMMIADVYRLEQIDHEPVEAAHDCGRCEPNTPTPAPAGVVDITVRALADVPPFMDRDGRSVKLSKGDVATVAPGVARVLLNRSLATLVDAEAA